MSIRDKRRLSCAVRSGSILACVVFLLGQTLYPSAQAQPACLDWNTDPYFAAATIQDASRCLDAGADPNAFDEFGRTPLYWAVRYDALDIVRVLISANAEVNVVFSGPASPVDVNGWTPLHLAAYYASPALVDALLAAGAPPSVRVGTGIGPTALHIAVERGSLPVVRTLIDHGANVNLPRSADRGGPTPLHIAAERGALTILAALIFADADIHIPLRRDGLFNRGGLTALHVAAVHGFPNAVSVLIGAGLDPNVPDDDGARPLHHAASPPDPEDSPQGRSTSFETIRTLLNLGAEVNVPGTSGNTPLHNAAAYASSEAVELLLDRGANPDAVGGEGAWLPVHRAAFNRRADNLRVLVPRTSMIDLPDHNGETALHAAAAAASLDSVHVLLSAGANACAPGWNGALPVHRARSGAPWTTFRSEYADERDEIVRLLSNTCQN